MDFILLIPVPVIVIIFIVLSVSFSFGGIYLVRAKFPHEFLRENHEVAGFVYNSFCVIYAVMLAFVVYINWNNYDKTIETVYKETNDLINLYGDANALPDSTRRGLQDNIYRYAVSVQDEELPALGKKETTNITENLFRKLWLSYLKISPLNDTQKLYLQESVKRINMLSEYRRLRYMTMESNIPSFIWVILIFCGIVAITFNYFFGMKNKMAQVLMTSTFTFLNLGMLYIIYALDKPFFGVLKISDTPFLRTIEMLRQLSNQ